MRTATLARWIGTLLIAAFLSWPVAPQEASHYTRFRDAKWYALQLQSLREELAKIDTDVRTLAEARKSGKGITDAVALAQEPEGVTTEGQMEVLRKRRAVLLRQIDALEEQSRHNAIVPGELRREYGPEEPETSSVRKLNREEKDVQTALAQEKEHLDHARKEAELLRRDQKLKVRQEFSNPEPRSRRNNQSELVGIGTHLVEKEGEVKEAEQKVADLEDRLEDLKRNSPASATETDAVTGEPANDSDHDERNEAYWRKQFAAIDYKLTTAQTELDILQRELNVGSVQYYPNPSTAMKESVTWREINEHRKAIEEQKKEIAELKKQRDALEDALRHAGGPAGWAR